MSEPKPPQLVMQETLACLRTETQALATQLTTLAETLTTELRGYSALTVAFHRDVTTLGQTVLQQRQSLDRFARTLATPARGGRRLVWSAGSGLAVGLGAMGLAWGLWPSPGPAAARLLTHVDQVLVQQWRTVPPPVQTQLTTVYSRAGVVSPAQRQGGKP